MKKTLIYHCHNATAAKLDELYEVSRRYGTVQADIYNRYGGMKALPVLRYPREVRDEWVKSGYAEKYGLQARQWKQAIDEAFAMLKSLWGNAARCVRILAMRSERFTKDEKHYICYLLKAQELLYKVLNNMEFDIPERFKEIEVRRGICHRWLHRQLRKHRGAAPKRHKNRSFACDANMYDVHTDERGRMWLGVMGLNRGKRIHLLLTSTPEISGNIRIVLRGNRVEIHNAVDIPCPEVKPESECKKVNAVDKGFSTLIDTSKGDQYGKGFGGIMTAESDRLTQKNRSRSKIRAIAEKCEQSGDIEKAERIQKNNLGRKKYARQRAAGRKKAECFINTALNGFLGDQQPDLLIVENLKFQSWNKILPKRTKRLFSSWLKGIMRKRIEYKCHEHGVLIGEVNAAYSSQECPFCHFVHEANRKGDRFHCLSCGRGGNAHYFSALNLEARYYDPDINLFTPYREVKKILLSRFNQSAETVQPGLQIPYAGGLQRPPDRTVNRRANCLEYV